MGRPAPHEDDRTARKELLHAIVASLHGMFQSVERYSKRSLRECGLTGPQIWALRILTESGPLTVGGLAARMYLHISTVSNLMNRLEAKELVFRRRDDPDHRVVHLAVTAAGRRVARSRPAPPRSRLSGSLERMGFRDLQTLHTAVSQIRSILQAEEEQAGRLTGPAPGGRRRP